MGTLGIQVLHKLEGSVNAETVAALYSCVASSLGFDTKMTSSLESGFENETDCMNTTCFINPVSRYLTGTATASFEMPCGSWVTEMKALLWLRCLLNSISQASLVAMHVHVVKLDCKVPKRAPG